VRTKRAVVTTVKAVAVLAILGWSLFPIVFIAVSSLKPGQDIFAVPPKYLFAPTIEHYVTLWTQWGVFFRGLLNSAVITVGATMLAVVASTCAGYVYSRHSGRFLNASVLALIVVRLIPPIVVTLPLFPLVNALHVNDTHGLLMVLYATLFVSRTGRSRDDRRGGSAHDALPDYRPTGDAGRSCGRGIRRGVRVE
jgi:multiple sugar transport system permease protein